MPKFLVVSTFEDEAQVFHDLIVADTPQAAEQLVADVRDYAEVCETWTEEEWRKMLEVFSDPGHSSRHTLSNALGDTPKFCQMCDKNLSDDDDYDENAPQLCEACKPETH